LNYGINVPTNDLYEYQTREKTQPSYKDKRTFLQKIDALEKGPTWTCKTITINSTVQDENRALMSEEVEMWFRDPVECVCELMGNPTFRDAMRYAPEKVFTDAEKDNQIYNEMWTAEWCGKFR
jgi:hypothetical protein